MKSSLILAVFLFFNSALAETVELSASSMRRSDLPNDFPFQVLDVKMAILEVKVRNLSASELEFDPAGLQIRNPKGKEMEQAELTEIVPKLMKYYRGGQLGVMGEIHVGDPRYKDRRQQTPTISPKANPSSISIDIAPRLRSALEYYGLKKTTIAPGESVKGFVYVKSKKSGGKLAGSKVEFVGATSTIP
jgi:hypothetical protein